jgi:antitoxin VapB
MALSIKTEKADTLARELARRTGETMTAAVERALEERLERVRREESREAYLARLNAAVEELRSHLDLSRPITKQEFDELWEE